MSADPQAAYLAALIEHGLLVPTGVDGLYGRSGLFEDVVDRFNTLISSWGGADGAEILRFPPALNRAEFERSDYLTSFPQLAGSVHSFCGHDADHRALLDKLKAGEDWSADLKPTKLVLTPAACYPVYPTVAARGPLPPEGRLIDVYSYCFRHEPSIDPARMQLFRMREYVRLGSAEQVTEFRQTWLTRGQELIASLELPLKLDIANDPFFGRAGRMLAANQRDQSLKFELLVPITREDAPTACLSFNYHQDHFGRNWHIKTADLEVAHSACVGFGMERVVLALFKHHGFKVESWPTAVREILWG